MALPKNFSLMLVAVSVPLAGGFLMGHAVLGQSQPPPPGPTPVPTVNPSRSTPRPVPVAPLSATPPAPRRESAVEATRRVIAGLDSAARKRVLTTDVVAVKTFGLPERPGTEIVLYHLPTGSQITIGPQGAELRRAITDAVARRTLEEVLHDSRLLAEALELAR